MEINANITQEMYQEYMELKAQKEKLDKTVYSFSFGGEDPLYGKIQYGNSKKASLLFLANLLNEKLTNSEMDDFSIKLKIYVPIK